MHHTVQDYVDRIEAKISWYRDRASKLIGWGRFINGPFAIVFYVVGAIAIITGFLNGSYRDPLFGRPIYHLLLWYTQSFPTTWTFMTWIGPSMPAGPQSVGSFGFLTWILSWAIGLAGLKWLGTKAVEEGKRLREQANKDQNQLEFQEPGWRQIEMLSQQMESLQNYQTVAVGAVNSSTVTIAPNITQQQKQMYTILTRGNEKKGWWTKPVGIIGLGVAVKVISSFLGLH